MILLIGDYETIGFNGSKPKKLFMDLKNTVVKGYRLQPAMLVGNNVDELQGAINEIKGKFKNLVCAVAYYTEKIESFDKVIEYYTKNLRIQCSFGLLPYTGKDFNELTEAEQKTSLDKRSKIAGLFGGQFVTFVEVDPPNIQAAFKSGETEPCNAEQAMACLIKRMKSGMLGERYFQQTCKIKNYKSIKIYGFDNVIETTTEESSESLDDTMNNDG